PSSRIHEPEDLPTAARKHIARCRLRNLRGEMAGEARTRLRSVAWIRVAAVATPLVHPCDDAARHLPRDRWPCVPHPGTHMDKHDGLVADPAPTAFPRQADGGCADTWITKEAGNRRIPYDRARLERAIDRVHAEFPQLDIADYKRSVSGFVERKDAVNADDLVDHLIREAEARVDVTAPEWEQFAARLYLHRLY